MKLNMIRQCLSTILILLCVSSLPVLSYADDTTGPIEKKVVIKEKTPEGLEIKDDQVSLKSGFSFERINPNHVNVISGKAGEKTTMTGSIECSCNGKTDGNERCEVVISENHVSCGKSSCKSICYMLVTPANKEVLKISN